MKASGQFDVQAATSSKKNVYGNDLIGNRMGFRTGLDAAVKRKKSLTAVGNSTPIPRSSSR
jgi:hypothetical protein